MTTVSLSHTVDADDIGYAIAGLDPEDVAEFARELVTKIALEGGDDLAGVFAAAASVAVAEFAE